MSISSRTGAALVLVVVMGLLFLGYGQRAEGFYTAAGTTTPAPEPPIFKKLRNIKATIVALLAAVTAAKKEWNTLYPINNPHPSTNPLQMLLDIYTSTGINTMLTTSKSLLETMLANMSVTPLQAPRTAPICTLAAGEVFR